MRGTRIAVALLLALAACGDDDGSGPPEVDRSVASVRLTASALSVALGDTITVTAEALTATGEVVASTPVWTSSPPGVLAFDDDDAPGTVRVHGDTPGSATLRATVGQKHDEITITVTRPAVARVEITPPPGIVAGQSLQLTARTFAQAGGELTGRRVDWSSDHPDVAIIDASTGMLRGTGAGTALVRATSEGIEATVEVVVTASPLLRALKQLSAGKAHTCAVDSAGTGWCWGANDRGQLGDGTRDDRMLAAAVSGNHIFEYIAAGHDHTCGVTTSGTVLCWGDNNLGQLGMTTENLRTVPTLVTGLPGVALQAAAGASHSCALLATGAAWCWGSNNRGQVGEGTSGGLPRPATAVKGTLAFNVIAAGAEHTCGTTNAAVWCWGANESGMLGDSTVVDRPEPVMVRGATGWQSPRVAAGERHGCGFGTDGIARCWGRNSAANQELGVLTVTNSVRAWADSIEHPGAVRLVRIGAGSAARHTCGIGTGGVAWCWGRNAEGQLGDRTVLPRSGAIAVLRSGLPLEHVTTGAAHTCALTTDGLGYCWGTGGQGRLGTGTEADQLQLTAVRRVP